MQRPIYYLEGEDTAFLVPEKVHLVKIGKTKPFLVAERGKGVVKKFDFFTKNSETSLAFEFSRLNKEKLIEDFASRYGLLGVDDVENSQYWGYEYDYLTNFKFLRDSEAESLDEWEWHINHVNRLLRLFDALQDSKPLDKYIDIDEARDFRAPPQTQSALWPLLRQQRRDSGSTATVEDTETSNWKRILTGQNHDEETGLHVYWMGKREKIHQPTLVKYTPPQTEMSREDDLRRCAWLVLESHILTFIEHSLYVDCTAARQDNRSVMGLSFADRKATNYLLAAIYYDVFRIVNNMKEKISFCQVCQGAFENKRKGALYCSNACRQENKRNKQEGTPKHEHEENVQTV